MVDDQYQIEQPTSQYFAAQLITQEWAEPKDAEHRQFLASSDLKDEQQHVLLTAYALQRPDGQWSVMLINKDHDHAHGVHIKFTGIGGPAGSFFSGPVTMTTFGKEQYQWHAARKKGHADPDGPAVKSTVVAGANTEYNLPAASLTVIRGNLNRP